MSGKILRMRIESYMGLNDVEIDWDEHYIMAVIADGGKGKTSLASFLRSALTGIIPDDAINVFTGQAKGSVDFEKDGGVYTAKFSKTKNSETVKIISPDKMEGSKQTLQKIVGNVDINPFALKKMDPDEQIKWFKKVGKIDTREIDEERQKIYKNRTAVNARGKTLKTLIAESDQPDPETEESLKEEKFLGDLPARRDQALQKNDIINAAVRDREELYKVSSRLTQEELEIDAEIQRLQKLKEQKIDEHKAVHAKIEIADNWIEANPIIDIVEIYAQIDEINEHNFERLRFLGLLERRAELEATFREANELTRQLEEIDRRREQYIKEKIIRVEGMELIEPKLDEEGNEIEQPIRGVIFEGKPISVLSSTEAIKFAMRLRKVLNGDALPILIIDDFETVGSQGRAELIKLCQEEGYSALIALMDPNQPELKVVIKNNLKFETDDPAEKKVIIKKKNRTTKAQAAQN